MAGLNLNSTTHFNQWIGINALNIKPSSAAAVALRPAFATRAGLLTSDLVLVGVVALRANVDLDGIAAVKDLAKLATADAYGVITSNCVAFAIQYSLVDLQIQMENATASMIFKTKDENFVAKCTLLGTTLAAVITANPVTALEYFTAAQLTAAAATIPTFTGKLGVFQAAQADVRSAKREFSGTWMPRMKAHIVFMTKMLPGAITTGFPGYVGAFELLLKLVNAGKRDQGLKPIVLDGATGNPFALVASFEPTNYPATVKPKLGKSDGSGDFRLMKMKVGLWRIKFSVPGFVTQYIMV